MLQRIALVFFLVVATARAQSLPSSATQPAAPKYLAHLVTMSPGQLVFERFGHNALFITDLTQSPAATVAYDFGNFDFNESDFLRRFVFGEMRYWAAEKDAGELLYGYLADNRQVFRQELNLTDEQVQQLWINLRENIRDENRFYLYDYYRDNCSTRLRDHIDRVVGGQIAGQLKLKPAAHTYRWHTRVGMDNDRSVRAGIEFAASGDTDTPITHWDDTFLPEQLRQHMGEMTLRSPAGQTVPLVRRSGAMNNAVKEASFVRLPDEPGNPLWWFALCGALVGAGLAACGALASRSTLGRWLAAVAWGGWGLFAGLGGTLLVFMWFFTRHVSTHRNENLLQLSPMALLLVVMGPMAAFGYGLQPARWVARILVALCMVGVALKVLPGWHQDNIAIVAFALVAQAGLLAGLLMRLPVVKQKLQDKELT